MFYYINKLEIVLVLKITIDCYSIYGTQKYFKNIDKKVTQDTYQIFKRLQYLVYQFYRKNMRFNVYVLCVVLHLHDTQSLIPPISFLEQPMAK